MVILGLEIAFNFKDGKVRYNLEFHYEQFSLLAQCAVRAPSNCALFDHRIPPCKATRERAPKKSSEFHFLYDDHDVFFVVV